MSTSGNPVNHFPVYEPTAERVAQITEEYSEANNPLNVHYDATREVRAKGAGFYAFSADDETRKQQMEELKAARVETEEVRQETGALNVKPGEVEGMRDQSTLRSRAMEKRKREIEERRRILDAKRRKVNQREASSTATPSDVDAGGSMATKIAPQPSSGPFAELEAVSTIKLRVAPSSEGDRGTEHKKSETQKGMDKAGPHDIANAFLAELERDIFGKNPDK
jgi:DNA-binding transcriptional MerR regulator